MGGTAYTALVNEYDTSIGPNGCNSRRAYITGRAVGDVVAFLLPAEKLTAMTKVKIIEKTEDIKYLSGAGTFTDEMAETYAGLAKSGPFKNKPIWGVRKDVSSFKAEMPWYGRPLESGAPFNDAERYAGRRFIDAVNSGYLQGDLQYGFYSLNRAIGDSYLMELTSRGDEIAYVLKQSGEFIIAPRGLYRIPHPILSGGEEVRSAGTIKFISVTEVDISNASGHLWPNIESLNDVEKTIRSSFPNIKIVRYNLKGN